MFSRRQRFLLTSLTYLALAIPSVAGWGPDGSGFGNDNGPPGNWNDGGWSGCAWIPGATDCTDDGPNDGSGTGGSDGSGNTNGTGVDSSQVNISPTELDRYNRIITIHAVLACLVWVFLIPLGGILIRSGLKNPHLLKIHAALQSVSYLIYAGAAAMGIYLVRELSFGTYSMWSDPHTKIGVGILLLALLMPALGVVHHNMYKKKATQFKEGGPRPGRTVPGLAHLWLGRILIVPGVMNGGLGIRLASKSPLANNPKIKIIAYSVCAAVMFLLYVIFVVFGEVRRTKERGQTRPDRRSVAMVAQEYQPVRAVDLSDGPVPPSYEQSQSESESSLPMIGLKHADSTARYT